MMNYKIYGLSEPDGETIRYIGFTGQPLNKRFNGHFSKLNNPSHKTSWINGLRKTNQRPEIILIEDNLSKEEALNKEIHYIKLFKSFGANLVNMTNGGDCGSTGMKGKIISQETREKIRVSSTGRKHSEATKKIIGIKSSQKVYSKETIDKMRLVKIKGVDKFDLERNFIEHFVSTREAERKTKISHSLISAVANGREHRKTAGGFIWKYTN